MLFLFGFPVFGSKGEKAEHNWHNRDSVKFSFVQQGLKKFPSMRETTVKACKYQACVTFYKTGCRGKQLSQCFHNDPGAEHPRVRNTPEATTRRSHALFEKTEQNILDKRTADRMVQLRPFMTENAFSPPFAEEKLIFFIFF